MCPKKIVRTPCLFKIIITNLKCFNKSISQKSRRRCVYNYIHVKIDKGDTTILKHITLMYSPLEKDKPWGTTENMI